MDRNLINREVKIGEKEGEITNISDCGYEVTFFNVNDGKTWVDIKDIEQYLVPKIKKNAEVQAMGMDIEVVGKTYYTVHLTDEDVEKVKKWIKNHEDDLPSSNMKDNICEAVRALSADCKIDLYSDNKATESDFCTEEINWSEYEDKTVEEILKGEC